MNEPRSKCPTMPTGVMLVQDEYPYCVLIGDSAAGRKEDNNGNDKKQPITPATSITSTYNAKRPAPGRNIDNSNVSDAAQTAGGEDVVCDGDEQVLQPAEEEELALLVSRMKSAGEVANANWDESANWGDADLPHFTKKMSDIAEDREKSWEGGGGMPSENLAEGGEGAGPRAAFDGNDSTSLLMDRMERLGDELLAGVDGMEDDEDDGRADTGEAGGRREGPRPERRDTNAILLRMDTLNAELAAEMHHLNDDDDDDKEDRTPSAVSVRNTTDLLNGMEDLGDVPRAPGKTTLEGLPKEAAIGDENEKGEEEEAARPTPRSSPVESETSAPPPAAKADGPTEGTKKGKKKRRSMIKRLSTKLPSPKKVLSRGK